MKQIFFQRDYYSTNAIPSFVHILSEHELTCMSIINNNVQRWPDDDIREVVHFWANYHIICGLWVEKCGPTKILVLSF